MYFSNVLNPELAHFHQTVGVDFTMPLSEILTSDLFKVEEIITGSLYRIYPLFYCKEVISSNKEDKVDNTRCLIVLKQIEHETYFSFMTDESRSNVIIDEQYLSSIKDLGDTLTTDEFNAFVYRLRKNANLTGNINFADSDEIIGVYGTYQFGNLTNQLRNNEGLIVNQKLKDNQLTVKLVNQFFVNAKYVLTFTVKSITGANVCEDSTNHVTETTFDIELVKDTPVGVDLSDYVNDSVLDFDVTVSVSFDVPEIVNEGFTLSLTASDDRISLGETVDLTATLTGTVVANYNIEFYEDNVLIDTIPTDNTGKAVLIGHEPLIAGNHIYSCKFIGMKSNVNVVVYNKNTVCDLEISAESIRVDNNIVLTGTLKDGDNNALTDRDVNLYENNVLIDTLHTGNDGTFTKTITHNIVNNYTYRAEYVGSDGYLSATSNIVSCNVYKYPTTIQLNAPATVYVPNSFTVTGTLQKEGSAFANTNIKLYANNALLETLTTNANGEFTKTITVNNPQTYAFKAVYDGTEKISGVTSSVKNTTARRIKTYLTANVNKTSIYLGEIITVSGRITDEFGNGIANCILETSDSNIGGTTDSNGYYSYSYNLASRTIGSHNVVVKFNGYATGGHIGNRYEKCQSDAITVNCIKYATNVNILNTATDYDVGDTILMECTSNDTNFNPSSIDVIFNSNTTTVSTKDSNGRFIFTIPSVSEGSNNFNITANYAGDNTHDSSTDTKTILVYNTLQQLVISKSGSSLVITGKGRHGNVAPNIVLNNLTAYFSNGATITVGSQSLDDNGTYNINNISPVSATVYVTSNNITSNTITWG